ncbi:MAG: DNA recombination protein RmuC [Clostridia bacterium]|nr:DNA recombination protein RmuC [Clostridia bacterium]
MELWQFIVLLAAVVLLGAGAIIAIVVTRKRDDGTGDLIITFKNDTEKNLDRTRKDISEDMEQQMRYLGDSLRHAQKGSEEQLAAKQDAFFGLMTEKQNAINTSVDLNAKRTEERFKTFESQTSAALNEMRETVERRLSVIQAENDKHLDDVRETMKKSLDEVRGVVDEKLQKTLNERITESFRLVNDRLTEVYQGLGEMKNLAVGVGDLKKVLTNVKTRGTLGEVQLGAILEEILAPEQYVKNFDAKGKTQERVEYAVRLPGDGDRPVYLPIDSKFPSDAYIKLSDAYESGDPALVAAAQRHLSDVIMKFARDVKDKYIDPPRTTEFAIMFLPTEGIYAEVVRLGMVEKLQKEARVNIAGPSTMAALLNSLRMGFSIVAMQKRSGEAWQVLGAVKKEFETFEDVLKAVQKRITGAGDDLEKLIGTRTRAIIRKLRDVEILPAADEPAAIEEENGTSL